MENKTKLLENRYLEDITIGENLLNQPKELPFIKENILNLHYFINTRAKRFKTQREDIFNQVKNKPQAGRL